MEQQELITAKTAAVRFDVPEYVVYRMAKEGRIKAHDLPPAKKWHRRRRVGYDPAEVARALGLPE